LTHTHLHTVPGIYTVTLTVSGLGGSDTLTRTGYITVTWPIISRVITYTYGDLYRLTGADYSTGESFAYGYDAVGNPVSTALRGTNCRLALTETLGVTPTVHSYQYDDANRLVNVDGQAYTWDDDGNLLNDGVRSFAYDAANRLTSVTSGTLTTTFEYDGLGNRVAQTVDGVETSYVLDVAGGLPEVIVATTGGASTQYVQVQGQILAQYGSGAWAYVLPDHLGSVRQLADANGQVMLAQSYDPFGVLLEANGSGASEFGYTGEWWGSYTQLTFLRARHYDPAVGRFVTKDPFSGFVIKPQSLNNRWAYVQNNPIHRNDPTGLQYQACETGRCGPSIDEWFLEEIDIHWDWVVREKHLFDLITVHLGDPNNPLWLAERHVEWVFKMRDYWKAIPHKWMNFSNLVPGCLSSGGCRDSVTLCDTCLERSELGNLLFGLTAEVAGLPNIETYTGGHDKAKGLQEPWDQAAAGVGYYFAEAEYELRVSNADTMCRIFRSSTGAWRRLASSRGPKPAPWNWSLIQDEKIEECEPCEQAIPASTPHTIPAYAGEPAGRSPAAGAPGYEYYTEQIPEGMLDPLMEISFHLPVILEQ
jgi:RHS repeat-associated protein